MRLTVGILLFRRINTPNIRLTVLLAVRIIGLLRFRLSRYVIHPPDGILFRLSNVLPVRRFAVLSPIRIDGILSYRGGIGLFLHVPHGERVYVIFGLLVFRYTGLLFCRFAVKLLFLLER